MPGVILTHWFLKWFNKINLKKKLYFNQKVCPLKKKKKEKKVNKSYSSNTHKTERINKRP